MGRTGVLLINLGTPDSAAPRDVRKYLLEFLTDGRVIDIPWLQRNLLVRGIIVPFRYRQSARTYREIWDEQKGSPLLYHSLALHEKVAGLLPENVHVELAMRYGKPSLKDALAGFKDKDIDKIIVFPLFPQYASSTTGSIHELVMSTIKDWQAIPEISMISDYYDHPGFIRAFADKIRSYDPSQYDHVLFSYHGLPERHMKKVDRSGNHCLAKGYSCCDNIVPANRFCYRAQCMSTTRSLVSELGLAEGSYTVCFQSRLGRDPWVQPYTSQVLEQLAEQGKKKILVTCPAFVADCLETVYEVGMEYAEEFSEMGGESVQLVESLNDSDLWAYVVRDLILQRIG